VLSLVVIGLISGGLTFKVTGDVNYAFTDAVERVAVRAVGYLAEVKDTVLGPRDADSEGRSPGETWALITGQGMVMGLDREGYVTWCDSASGAGDLPALTGFLPAGCEPGVRLSTPEAVLGLAIVRAFELSPFLMDVLSEVNLEDLEHPRVILTGGTLAELGHGAYVAKVERLGQILMQARQQNMHVARIDLRFGRQVVVEWDRAPRGFDKEV
jgi:hypothetical protein